MNNWKYQKGQWIEIDDPLKWADYPDEDFEAVLERAGFSKYPGWSFGPDTGPHSLCVDLYETKTKNDLGGPPWLISFTLAPSCIGQVYIDDPLSLLQWMREYLPIFMLSDVVNELMARAAK